jgi:hypothetical protein
LKNPVPPAPPNLGIPETGRRTRELAQQDPVPNLSANWASAAVGARTAVERLTTLLRDLDKTRDQLLEHGIEVSVDLGPIGNAAAAARRDLEKKRDTPAFEMPR